MLAGLNTKKILIVLAVVLVVVAAALLIVTKFFLSSVKPVTLTYYGLWEDPKVMDGVISDFTRVYPNITVHYLKQDQINYRERMSNDLQKEGGPDIVRIHSSWLPMFKNLLAPVPSSIMTPAAFDSTFYPAHKNDLKIGNTPYAIPLEIDGLVMFVNTDLLTQAGMSPATTWEEFQDQVQRLTVRDPQGRIQTAGTALGTVSNVDHWQDIMALMILQNGSSVVAPSGPTAEGALRFYTDFVTKLNVWDETQDNSTLAFAKGKVVYYFGPTWRFFDLKTLANGGKLNFKVYPVPQLPGPPVYLSTYWAEGVSVKSPNQKEAFEFLQFLAKKENLTKLYTAESSVREFGEPYSRVDLQTTLSGNANVGPFIANADKARTTLLSSFTWDGATGINSRISKYYADAINGVLRGGDTKTALATVSQGIGQVLGDYGYTVPQTPAP